ncbi:heavy-metal-associated domain-containing protein [Neotabrizicola sp. VNH66]|uniref:heavy-metal-associated domain-containing protein n=1 Tax=Neotabrizicola sp. VNH66 TaxID=3400918 RepID=UPI003C08A6D5
MEFRVENMTCSGCVRGVTRAIQGLDPAAEVKTDLDNRKVEVETAAPRAAVIGALAEAGFTAV